MENSRRSEGGSRERGRGKPDGRGGGRRFFKAQKKRYCRFCAENPPAIDYKNVGMIRSFLTERAKIVPRRISGNCAKHQRMVTEAIKRARILALVPFTAD